MVRRGLGRVGAIHPIVTIVAIVAFTLAGVALAWFIVGPIFRATRTPLVRPEPGAYIVGGRLYVTVRNDGTAPFDGTLTFVLIDDTGAAVQATYDASEDPIRPGESRNLPAMALAGTFTPGRTYEGFIRVPGGGEEKFVAECLG